MKKIGITGGIGAGKSVVSRGLRSLGFPVYDCDSRAKALMEDSPELKFEMSARWGMEAILLSGAINRGFVASVIFNDAGEREWLNGEVHRLVEADFSEYCEAKEREGFGFVFIESAIIHTSGLDRRCDLIWLVEADADVRTARAFARGGVTMEDIGNRIRVQQSEFDSLPITKVRVIENNPDSELLSRIKILLKEIIITQTIE